LIHFYKRIFLLYKMSYKDRDAFSPSDHGLDPKFRLTNFTKLKG